jgi:hypothetical protein
MKNSSNVVILDDGYLPEALRPRNGNDPRGWAYAKALEAGLLELGDSEIYKYTGLCGGVSSDTIWCSEITVTGSQVRESFARAKKLYDLEKQWQTKTTEGVEQVGVHYPNWSADPYQLYITLVFVEGPKEEWEWVRSHGANYYRRRKEVAPGSNVWDLGAGQLVQLGQEPEVVREAFAAFSDVI